MFSVVLPVHNEESMLKRTFKTVLDLRPDEIVVILDRCNDASEMIVKVLARRYRVNLKLIHVSEKSDWKIHLNYLYDLGIRQSSNDVVLLTQADIALDAKIRQHMVRAKDKILFFGYIPYISWSGIIAFVQFNLPYKYRSTGLIAINKNVYLKYSLLEDMNLLFDTQIAIKSRIYRIPSEFIMTKSWNLRPYVRTKLYELGYARCMLKDNIIKVLTLSIIRAQPEIFVGYLWCKLRSHE